MRSLIKQIFSREELLSDPPVLIDIGASEHIHKKWKSFAEYSICLAFDADERDFDYKEEENKKFKKLYTYNCIVSNYNSDESDFYLTKSPYCSSLLKPTNHNLEELLFSPLFKVEKVKKIKTVELSSVLKNLKINKIDWFKTDSQGIDLRLFENLDEEIKKRVMVSEFEPGFVNLYDNEDRLFSILSYMDTKNFWLSDFKVKGTPRIPFETFESLSKNNLYLKFLRESQKIAPTWAEMTYINDFKLKAFLNIREYLLGWLFATVENQHTFALNIAKKGIEKFDDEIFRTLEKQSILLIKRELYKLKFIPSLITKLKKIMA